jgi:hypothetical protein
VALVPRRFSRELFGLALNPSSLCATIKDAGRASLVGHAETAVCALLNGRGLEHLMAYDAQNPSKPPPEVCAEDWRYLSGHLGDERLHDLHVLLGECPQGFGAKLVAEIRTLLPCSQPGHALVLALARVAYDADEAELRREWGSPKERRRDEPL